MARSLETVHAKAKSYDWPFTVGDQRPKFPTQYTIPATGKDPFRMLIRDYVKMEAEKDDRTHGFLDGLLRMGTAGEVQPPSRASPRRSGCAPTRWEIANNEVVIRQQLPCSWHIVAQNRALIHEHQAKHPLSTGG